MKTFFHYFLNPVGTFECRNKDNGYICVCKDGYTGLYCEEDVDNCVDHQCKNGGVCLDKADGYICDCPQPYVGKLI